MDIPHRFNTRERQHYLLKSRYSFHIKPRILYVGRLEKNGGWKEDTHCHSFCEILYISEGSGWVTVDGKRHIVTKGDVVIYNPEVPHEEESSVEEPMELLFMALDHVVLPGLPENHLMPATCRCVYHTGKYQDVFFTTYRQMVVEFEQEDELYIEIAQEFSRTLLMYIFRMISQQESRSKPLLKGNKNTDKALAYIREHFRENIALEDVATGCYLDKYYLSHLFTKHEGMSVGKYILMLRVDEAMRLLRETDLSVQKVAESVGFEDVSYFCRIFKKSVTMTPLQYRRQEKKEVGFAE